MRKGFIAPKVSAGDMLKMIDQLKEYDVAVENITIGKEFNEFINSVNSGDSIIVISFTDIFGSLTELFTKAIDMANRGIEMRSVNEPNIVFDNEQIELMKQLNKLGYELRTIRTKIGLTKARESGKRLGRPIGSTKIDDKVITAMNLYKTSNISIEKACQIAGCKPRTFYRYQSKGELQNN